MNMPEIRIRSSYLLNNALLPLLLPGLKESGHETAADRGFIYKTADEYSLAWAPYETQIITAMCEMLGIEFKQNIIDAYVLPMNYSFSDPMIISTKYEPDRFIEILTHELIHRLLTDNTSSLDTKNGQLLKIWKELFGEEHSTITLVHIPVHAVLEYIFRDTLKEQKRLERDIESCQKHEDYTLAWGYVQSHGYKKIIDSLRSSYVAK